MTIATKLPLLLPRLPWLCWLLFFVLQDIPSTADAFAGARTCSSSSTTTTRRCHHHHHHCRQNKLLHPARQQSIPTATTTPIITTASSSSSSLLAAAASQQQQEEAAAAATTTTTTTTTTTKQQQQQHRHRRRHRHDRITPQTAWIQQIGPCIGKGSYGTVHWIQLVVVGNNISNNNNINNNHLQEKEKNKKDSNNNNNNSNDDDDQNDDVRWMIGKRAWTRDELLVDMQQQQRQQQQQQQQQPQTKKQLLLTSSSSGNSNDDDPLKNKKAARCLEYYQTEQHCFEQLLYSHYENDNNSDNDNNDATLRQRYIAPYRGTARDEQGREWMIFDVVSTTAAATTSTTTTTTNDDDRSNNNENQQSQQQLDNNSSNNNNNHHHHYPPLLPTSSPRHYIAPSLQDLLEQDRIDHQTNRQHHLYFLSKALGLLNHEKNDDDDVDDDIDNVGGDVDDKDDVDGSNNNNHSSNTDHNSRLVDTLDVVITQILEMLTTIHARKIVHRDIKPGNLLIGNNCIVLIDFGSAADLSSSNAVNNPLSLLMGGGQQQGVGWSQTHVAAVSPIYAAPEIFIDASDWKSALTFDCFSAGLLVCQLLFQYLDERTESGFHQQLRQSNWILDEWLRTTLQSKVQPAGLDEALEVLQERPGLWRLLQGLLEAKPYHRLSSQEALEIWRRILKNGKDNNTNAGATATTTTITTPSDRIFDDGPYLREVLQVADSCLFDVPPIRPLHFVATFERKQSLGLVLAEADTSAGDDDDDDDDDMPEELKRQWIQATQGARPGEVFVKEILKYGQADEMGIFAIGDRLQGVGELPLAEGGFERAVELLQDQPKNSAFVTLHFDRQLTRASTNTVVANRRPVIVEGPIQVADQGAWSSRGRRKAQEDAFILNEVHDTKERSVLLAGVMDGHLGRAASLFVREELPKIFSEKLLQDSGTAIEKILEEAWEQTCESYHNGCISGEECVADYDPREGMLMANTGSIDAIAGTTACLLSLDKQTSHMALLNCGDSRGVIVHSDGKMHFQTTDHTPEYDAERFRQGRQRGLEYSEPRCAVNKWSVPVGDYVYAVARSLEGPFATSKGIVWTPDVTVSQAEPGSTVVIATDGLWEVMGSEQVSQILTKLRHTHSVSASDSAKTLCSLALEKGAADNVSVVVVYLT